MNEATLREIAARRPAPLTERVEISGLGTKKLEAYCETVLGGDLRVNPHSFEDFAGRNNSA